MKKALVVYGGWDGHSPKATSELIAGDLRAAGFDVTISDSLDALLDAEKLKTYDLLVPNWTMGQITGDQEKALVSAVAAGTGLGGFSRRHGRCVSLGDKLSVRRRRTAWGRRWPPVGRAL